MSTEQMARLHRRFGSDFLDWARVMMSARSARARGLRDVAADRLRSAAEYRQLMGAGR